MVKKMRKCSRCGVYGHNKRTCKFSNAEVKEIKAARSAAEDRFKKMREENKNKLIESLVDGLNALARIAESDYYLEGGHGDTREVWLESSRGELHLDGSEAVAVVVASIAERVKADE
tara:strand:- start:40 stop:390 length:351 start_codon:yes stop_codon:yes gene_type:complete